jgi:serine/threonine protein kinase
MGANPSIVLEKEIGRGTYGVVHQGTYQNKPVAIKKFHQVLLEQNKRANYDHFQQEYTKECKLLTSLSHPHIVRVIGVFTVKEENVLVMELLHETLRDYLGRTKEEGYVLSIRGAVRISCEIVAGLNYLHSLKPPLVHRHLNGRNVLLTEKGLVKISDSGLATLCPIDLDYLKSMPPECIAYVAPEVLIGENPPQFTDKVDMFSVGVLMLQIVTCLDPSTTLQGIGTIPEVERRSSHLKLVPESHPLRILIISCLNDDPQKRISSDLEAFDRGTVLCDNFKGISFGSLQEFFPTERTVLKMAVVSGDICNGRQAVIRRYVCDEFVDNSFAELGEFTPVFILLLLYNSYRSEKIC